MCCYIYLGENFNTSKVSRLSPGVRKQKKLWTSMAAAKSTKRSFLTILETTYT